MRTVLTFLLLALHLAADEGWKPAAPGYRFAFPDDHASHPDYRIEWWYWTGNLETAEGQRFGYQLTFFRSGVEQDPGGTSTWSIRDLYLAHFAVSDLGAEKFHHAQQLHRAGIARAGDTFDPATGTTQVWNDR